MNWHGMTLNSAFVCMCFTYLPGEGLFFLVSKQAELLKINQQISEKITVFLFLQACEFTGAFYFCDNSPANKKPSFTFTFAQVQIIK